MQHVVAVDDLEYPGVGQQCAQPICGLGPSAGLIPAQGGQIKQLDVVLGAECDQRRRRIPERRLLPPKADCQQRGRGHAPRCLKRFLCCLHEAYTLASQQGQPECPSLLDGAEDAAPVQAVVRPQVIVHGQQLAQPCQFGVAIVHVERADRVPGRPRDAILGQPRQKQSRISNTTLRPEVGRHFLADARVGVDEVDQPRDGQDATTLRIECPPPQCATPDRSVPGDLHPDVLRDTADDLEVVDVCVLLEAPVQVPDHGHAVFNRGSAQDAAQHIPALPPRPVQFQGLLDQHFDLVRLQLHTDGHHLCGQQCEASVVPVVGRMRRILHETLLPKRLLQFGGRDAIRQSTEQLAKRRPCADRNGLVDLRQGELPSQRLVRPLVHLDFLQLQQGPAQHLEQALLRNLGIPPASHHGETVPNPVEVLGQQQALLHKARKQRLRELVELRLDASGPPQRSLAQFPVVATGDVVPQLPHEACESLFQGRAASPVSFNLGVHFQTPRDGIWPQRKQDAIDVDAVLPAGGLVDIGRRSSMVGRAP
mmetsp:Transcript_113499/g.360760  ORF Transcript_113499/g.360760 Transcript_113499/m.360760 type:complete len:537 (+) Transcript_113499:1055-2665(+)